MENHVVEYYYTKKKQTEYVVDKNGKLHREDGPAVIKYFEDGKIQKEHYFRMNEYHRLDGPALIIYDENGSIKYQEYWIHGMRYDDMFKYLVMVGSMEK
jgi:antitoxin component YwqK of YwqJK toxin-antitoxin module